MLNKQNYNSVHSLNLNFGPQHPAAHGVLRLILRLENERIISCDPHIGLLHRGSEFLIETKPYYLSLPYFDRMDYVSILLQEHAFCLAIENNLNHKKYSVGVLATRMVFDELTRVLNHLLAIACHALDVGSMSPIFWAFEERENIMYFYEYVSGARMHAAYYRPIVGNRILPKSLISDIFFFLQNFNTTLSEINSILLNNKIWKSRLVGLGIVSLKNIECFGLSGVMARSAGVKMDLRVFNNDGYALYPYHTINSYITKNGDSYDRYNLRMYEMLESSNIINTILCTYFANKQNNQYASNISHYYYMEDTISKFKFWSGSYSTNKGTSNGLVESAKGIFGVSIMFNGSAIPLRCKVRSPSYNHLLWLGKIARGYYLSDLVALIGTIDIVFGEIDR